MHGASIKAFFLDACTLTRATEITISLLFAAADQNKSAVDLAFFHRSMLRLLTRLVCGRWSFFRCLLFGYRMGYQSGRLRDL